jgi:hypothetical protein
MELTTPRGKTSYAPLYLSLGQAHEKAWDPGFGGTVKGDLSDRPFQVW